MPFFAYNGKVRRITRGSGEKAGADLEFRYDAAGQRVVKVVKTGSNELNWNYQYYLRDAQGNVMATYHKTNAVSGDTSVYRIANQWLYSNQGAGAFGDFAQGQLHQGSQFGGAMLQAIQDWQEYEATMGGYSLGTMLGWDPNLIYIILQNMEGNSSTTQQEDMFQTIWNQSHSAFIHQLLSGYGGNMLVNILDADATNEELLNQLYLQNNTAFANLYADLYNMYGTPPIPAFNLSNAISFIRNNVANNEQVINMLGGYFSPSEIEAAAMQLSQGLVQSALPFGSFVQLLNCMPASDLCTAIANNYPDLAHLRDLLMQYADPGYMLGLALQNDPNFIKTTSQNQSYLVAEALRMLEDMSVESYLRKVEQGYGGSVLEDLLLELQGDLTFTKKLVLKEHHLYGSSRLGVKTHKRVLLRKVFSISGFSEGGEVVEEEVTDSFVYSVNENYFCRTLGLKQFEMTNHLGNVLATVLDRKTGVFDIGADTLMYYKADVVSASMYYPFGQAMMSYKNEDFVFSYGLNGQEKEDEVFEGVYSAEYWMYDSRLGRRWNVDPKDVPSFSPYSCFANNPLWFSDVAGDSAVDSKIISAPDGTSRLIGSTVTQTEDKQYLITPQNFVQKWNNDAGLYINENVANVNADKTSETEDNRWYSVYNWPVLGSSQRVTDAFNEGDYLSASAYLLTGIAEALTFGTFTQVKMSFEFSKNITKGLFTSATKTGGRLGNAATRSQIDNIATTLESRGYTITGGGGRTAEEFLKPLGGGRKGGSFLDITATHPNYPTLRINTVDVYKNGRPTLRELNNATRIRTQIAPGEHLLLIPKR